MRRIKKPILADKKRIDEVNIPWSMDTPQLQSFPQRRSKLSQAQVGTPPEMIGDATYTQPIPPMEDTEAIRLLIGQAITLFHGDRIQVQFNSKRENAVLYDVYFDNSHTILVLKPEEMFIGLVNKNMDKDHFADVLEDIEEVQKEEHERTVAKKLLDIAKVELEPDIPEIEGLDDEGEDISDELTQAISDDAEEDYDPDIGDLYLDDDPDADTAPPEDEDEGNESPEETEEEEDFIQKESIKHNNKEADMQTAKDIAVQYGYTLLNDKLDIESIAQYFNESSLKEFGAFLVKLNEHNYENVYGIYSSKYDPNAPVVPIVENGERVYVRDGKRKDQLVEQFTVGETVKVDLTRVRSDYAKQIHGMVRRNRGFAIIESVEGDVIKIAENKNRAKIVGGVPINRDAIVKIERIKDSCVVYEEKDLNSDFNKMITEKKERDKKFDDNQKKWDSVVISEDIMNAGFSKRAVELVEKEEKDEESK